MLPCALPWALSAPDSPLLHGPGDQSWKLLPKSPMASLTLTPVKCMKINYVCFNAGQQFSFFQGSYWEIWETITALTLNTRKTEIRLQTLCCFLVTSTQNIIAHEAFLVQTPTEQCSQQYEQKLKHFHKYWNIQDYFYSAYLPAICNDWTGRNSEVNFESKRDAQVFVFLLKYHGSFIVQELYLALPKHKDLADLCTKKKIIVSAGSVWHWYRLFSACYVLCLVDL